MIERNEMADSPIVEIVNLRHTYLEDTPMETMALRDASLQIGAGEVVGLIGESGAGKSTLAHFLNGLIRPRKTGHVSIFGQDTARADCDLATLRRQVGLVFQYAHHQLIERYVGDDIALGPRQLELSRQAVRERVYEAMAAVGLDVESFVDRETFSLSGGEMRRVALAGALALEPELLVLDEATAGLDPAGRRDVHRLIRSLREAGTSVLLISNDMDEVADLADRVVALHEGRTVAEGPPLAILSDADSLEHWGLAAPSAAQVIRLLREEGLPIEGPAVTSDQAEEAIWRAMTH